LPETTQLATPDEPTASFPPAGAPAPENPRGVDASEKGRASINAPLVEALPRYDRNAPPAYPRLARERGWEGEVLLRVVVTEGGRVREVTVERSSGHALLDSTALRAVRRWRFHPCRLGATPVEGEVRIPVRFELRES
jgi:protein TonB